VYLNVNFNVFFKLIKVHLLVSELYIHQNARCNDKNCLHTYCKGKGEFVPGQTMRAYWTWRYTSTHP